ncbi:MAG: alpha/beta fold hydrolase [Chloroflexi bacterium]|nr:alpha/beta fold hydrolase [Chloroflexota bacterium]
MPFAKLEDSLETYYEVDDFTDPWKMPETIVLHHGMGKNSRMWYGWVPVLARRYRVVRFDARGFGQSSAPPQGYRWSLSGFARDVRLLLDYLKLDRVHLVGETLGGSIAMQFAIEHPERLRSLTVCSPPFHFTKPSYAADAEEIENDGMAAFTRRSMARRLDPSQVDPAFVEWYIGEMGRTSGRVAAAVLRAMAGSDLRDRLARITTPTLIMSAKDFFIYAPDELQRMQKLIPNAELKVFSGVSGMVHYAQPEMCAHALLEFLGKL